MKIFEAMYTDDATCHKNYMRYFTGQKLLLKCNEKAYTVMCTLSMRSCKNRPRTKYNDVTGQSVVCQAAQTYKDEDQEDIAQTAKLV